MKTYWDTPVQDDLLALVQADTDEALREARSRSSRVGRVVRTFNDYAPCGRSSRNTGWEVTCLVGGNETVYSFILYDKLDDPEFCANAEDLAQRTKEAIARRLAKRDQQ